ncbi:1-phosphatidylinositol phosphodiesterase-like, partial [Danio aesculapii]|uniref:1-phosphatidylinositol phosphodiesterase-like n=1 Tax=Danio aesculapii TaxID=1142201 RepID=UPI0024BF39D1
MGNLQYFSVFIVVLLCNCEAKKHVSSSESLSRKYIKHKWMEKLEDSRLLSSISIPGTHQSSKHLKTSKPRFQSWVLHNQLDAGVRFFELSVSSNTIKYDGSEGVQESETLSYVLKTLLTFLAKQDSETVLLRITPDEGAVAQVTEKLNRKKSEVWEDNEIPTMGQVRGKIVLIQSSTLKLGLPIQITELDGDAKETQMRQNIKLASENCDQEMRLSYIGAKGESEDPLEIAKTLNKPVDDYLLDLKGDTSRPNCVGIIAMDFPGPKVIETIINFNGKLEQGSKLVDDTSSKDDVALPNSTPGGENTGGDDGGGEDTHLEGDEHTHNHEDDHTHNHEDDHTHNQEDDHTHNQEDD